MEHGTESLTTQQRYICISLTFTNNGSCHLQYIILTTAKHMLDAIIVRNINNADMPILAENSPSIT